jgi:hypothetical protein
MGKSRLLEELCAMVRAAGGRVLSGRAFEAEMVRPYGALLDALRALGESEVPEALRADVAPLVPSLPHAGPGDRQRLFDGVVQLLESLAAAGRPLALVLDDVHWLDEAGAALLSYVARACRSGRVLTACAARPGELLDNPQAARALRGLDRDGRLERMELEPLGEGEIATLTGSAEAARLCAESGGNPLFAIEMARATAQGRDPNETLDQLIADRLETLQGRARDLLPFAAALGRTFGAELCAGASGMAPADLLGALDELERRGILRAAGAGAFDFAHDLYRRAAYHTLSEPRRRLVHRQIATALVRMPDGDGALAGDLAHHAALGGDALTAADACIRAGERCLTLFALSEADRIARRGLHLIDSLPREEHVAREIPLFRVLVFSRTCRETTPALAESISRAVIAAEGAGLAEQVQLGFHLLAMIHWRDEDVDRAVTSTLRSAEAARDVDPESAARALAATSRCLVMLERDMERAIALAHEASQLASQARVEPPEVAWALGMVRHFSGEFDPACEAHTRALRLYHGREHWGECMCLIDLATLALEHGDPAMARDKASEAAEVAHKLGEGSEGPLARAIIELARVSLGEAGAEDALAQAIAALRDVDAKGPLAYVLDEHAVLELRAGRPAEARRAAEEALGAATTLGRRSEIVVALSLAARAAEAAGDRASARAHREALAKRAAEAAPLSARARTHLSAIRDTRS